MILQSKFQLCSLALLELGLRPISSFQDDSNIEAAQVCGEMYDYYARYLLTSSPWRFSMFKQRLGLLPDPPINEWSHVFQLPADKLKIHAVFSSEGVGFPPYHRYELFEDKIYTDVDRLWIDYQRYVDPSKWPAYFAEFAIMAFAAKLAPILTDRQETTNAKSVLAWGTPQDNRRGGLFGQAAAIDSKQAPSEPISSYPLFTARFS